MLCIWNSFVYMAYCVSGGRRAVFDDSSAGLTEEQIRRRAKRNFICGIVKIVIFLIAWLFFTLAFALKPPFELVEEMISLKPNEKQVSKVADEPTGDYLSVELRGQVDVTKTMYPSRASENDTYVKVAVETFNTETNQTMWESKSWHVYIDDSDSDELHTVKDQFHLDENLKKKLITESMFEFQGKEIGSWSDSDLQLQVTLLSNHDKPIAMAVTVNSNPINTKIGVWLGLLLLIFLYVLIAFDITDRTFAALLVATTAIGVLSMLNLRPSLHKIIHWIDMETLMLLFGMMVMVSIISETGLFDYLSVFAYQLSKGKIWRLLFYLYMFTGILSAFLDNVTIVLLMVPVTIRLCEILAIDSTIVLVSVAIFSNIGGTLTPVGDPPNVIIATNEHVRNSGVNFGNFMLHMFPGVLLSMIFAFLMVYYMTRNKIKLNGNQLQRSIAALEGQAENNSNSKYMGNYLKHIAELRRSLKKEETLSPASYNQYEETLQDIKTKHKIKDMPLLIKCCVVLGIAVLLFLFCSIPDFKGITLGWTAVLAALLILILADKPDVDAVIQSVEWSTLVFFAALFVLMEALVDMGLIDGISNVTTSVISSVDKDHQLTIGIFLVLWFSAISSAFVDNIPITTLMLKLTIKLANSDTMALSFQPLVWALSFGACFGGNGTLIGASANVVTAALARQHGYDIGFLQFLFIGFPIMIVTVIVATVYLLIAHCLLTWH